MFLNDLKTAGISDMFCEKIPVSAKVDYPKGIVRDNLWGTTLKFRITLL